MKSTDPSWNNLTFHLRDSEVTVLKFRKLLTENAFYLAGDRGA